MIFLNSSLTSTTDPPSSTSPSVYIQVLGTLAVMDACDTVSPALTSPIISFPPGALSTWKPPPRNRSFSVGAVWGDAIVADISGVLAPLTIKDLACPTWGLGRKPGLEGSISTTIGPPWLPLIVPPTEAFSVDPTWSLLCTGMNSDLFALRTVAIFDPPIALTRKSRLVPDPVGPNAAPTSIPAPNHADPTTVPDNRSTPSAIAAKPAASLVDSEYPPAKTEDFVGDDSPKPSLAIASPAADPGSPPFDPTPVPTRDGGLPVEPKAPQLVAPTVPAGGAEDPSANVIASAPDTPDSPYRDPKTALSDPEAPIQPSREQGDGPQPQDHGLGVIIHNAFGIHGPILGGIANVFKTILVPTAGVEEVSIGGGRSLIVDPPGVRYEGKTYSAGGPAMTLSNEVYTIVATADSANSATNDNKAPINSPPLSLHTLTIAGHIVLLRPTGMIIDSSSVLPGGNAVTISNTPISLNPSSILIVGTSSFSLLSQSIFTIGTQSFTANPKGFPLADATILPGAAARTVSGTVISLGLSGALVIGSSTISLPTLPFAISSIAVSEANTAISAGDSAGTITGVQSCGNEKLRTRPISVPPLLTTDKSNVEDHPSLEIVDGETIHPSAPGSTVEGSFVSLAAGSATLAVGTGRSAMSTSVSKTSASAGGQTKGIGVSLMVSWVSGIGVILVLMLIV